MHSISVFKQAIQPMSSTLPFYQYVDTWEKARSVCAYLRNGMYSVFAFDLEGVNLGRDGQVTLLQIAVNESVVFCFDLLLLGPTLLGPDFLGPIFVSPHLIKLCFDCRVDGDVLKSHFGLGLQCIYDIQILYTMLFQAKGDRFLKGLRHVLQHSGIITCRTQLHHVLSAKTKIKALMATDTQLFKARPLSAELLQYCTADVIFLLRMYCIWRHLRHHDQIIAMSMCRLHSFIARSADIPSRQMSVLDFLLV